MKLNIINLGRGKVNKTVELEDVEGLQQGANTILREVSKYLIVVKSNWVSTPTTLTRRQ